METIAYIAPSSLDFRCGSIDGQSRGRETLGLSKHTPIRLEVKSIFSDSNMEIQIQMYGNLFVPITLINHGYASILIPFEPEIEVQSHSEINCARGNYPCMINQKSCRHYTLSETEFLRFAVKTISGMQEFYPIALTSSSNFLLKRRQ